MIEPSGTSWGYHGAATGKGRQVAKSELEKLDLGSLDARQAVKEAAKIIYLAHEDSKDKDFELEMTWVSQSATGGKHEFVPADLLQEAKQYAIDELSGGDDMEE
ncbi:proteasome core particle subunit alpha 7 [Sugiyamaella lignohabitans]|uniref:Proteasome core particle subunit alpha 7 n=1 Tax=Sugiyamaella lignohabitans TaxID=796027 RepID=A0A167F7Z8_9ASCO|nr:proteasome core particle subunit alpha 7 [Sugiyamaella lignohabitans]ANB14931.1 proteasome core particle subunit alpha 7 [Sugiyamaella lignohabitans]